MQLAYKSGTLSKEKTQFGRCAFPDEEPVLQLRKVSILNLGRHVEFDVNRTYIFIDYFIIISTYYYKRLKSFATRRRQLEHGLHK